MTEVPAASTVLAARLLPDARTVEPITIVLELRTVV
jgi:hypothetical protein